MKFDITNLTYRYKNHILKSFTLNIALKYGSLQNW